MSVEYDTSGGIFYRQMISQGSISRNQVIRKSRFPDSPDGRKGKTSFVNFGIVSGALLAAHYNEIGATCKKMGALCSIGGFRADLERA